MAQHRRPTRINGYTRTINGRARKVQAHSRHVTYGSRKRSGKGWFQLRRSYRHLTARPARGKPRRKWSKKKKAGFMALGVAEIVGWTLFRTTGGVVALLAVALSGLSLMLATGNYGRMAKARKPPVSKKAGP